MAAVDRVLYPITVGYTLVIFGLMLYEFFQGGAYKPMYPIGDVYLALLTAYAAQREGVKWLGDDEAAMRIRRGELFVGAWFAVYLFLWAIANLFPRWALPGELKTITLGVLGIFVATGISSGIRQRRSRSGEAGALNSDRRHVILRLLNERKSLSSTEAATTLGISQSSAWRILETLVKEGLAQQQDGANNREKRYILS